MGGRIGSVRAGGARCMVAIAIGAVAAVGCASAEVKQEEPPASGHDAVLGGRATTIAPGKFLELNCEVPASAIVAATAPGAFESKFASDQAIAWNVHEHDGEKVVVDAEGSGQVGATRYVPSHPGPVSLLWENKGTVPAHLALELVSVPPGTTCRWYP